MSLETNSANGNEMRANWLELKFKLIIINLTLFAQKHQQVWRLESWTGQVNWSVDLETRDVYIIFILKGKGSLLATTAWRSMTHLPGMKGMKVKTRYNNNSLLGNRKQERKESSERVERKIERKSETVKRVKKKKKQRKEEVDYH